MTSPAPAEPNPTQTPDAPNADAATSPSESGGAWFDAMTGREPADFATDEEQPTAAAEQTERGVQGSDQPPDESQPIPEPAAQPDSPQPDDVVRLTRTQLEREIQSRADKLIAKQRREDAKAAAEAARQAQAQAQEAELDRRLEEDPYGVAEEIRTQRQQAKSLTSQLEPVHTAIRDTSAQFDRLVVDRVVTALPPDVQQKLYEAIQPVGIEGRSQLVAAALDEIRAAAIAEGKAQGEKAAEQKLRKSSSFRKELLAELRGSEEEPELMNGSGPSPQPANMDDWIRQAMHAGRPY